MTNDEIRSDFSLSETWSSFKRPGARDRLKRPECCSPFGTTSLDKISDKLPTKARHGSRAAEFVIRHSSFVISKQLPRAQENSTRILQPPAQGGEQTHPRCQPRKPQQQHADVPEEDDHAGKEIALAGNVSLARLERLRRKRNVE